MATFGWLRNKSKSEVYSKEEADQQFVSKADLISAFESYAKKMHASSSSDYGLGTSAQYGHVKIVDSYPSTVQPVPGLAFSAQAGEALKTRMTNAEATLREVSKYSVPTGHVAISSQHSNPTLFAREMGYGTWEYIGNIMFEIPGGTSDVCYGFVRVS